MTSVSNEQDTPSEQRPDDLNDELAKKYDPERLLKMVSKRAGRGQSLDHSLRNKYEKRFGVDLGHVRIYTGEFAEEFNRQRGAYAVTIGSTGMILMGGSTDRTMGSAAGQALLAHELTHVAQAKRGLHFKSAMPLATEEHEQEAEAVEAEALANGGDLDHIDTHGDGKLSAAVQAAKVENKKKLDEAIEKIKERVLEMATDAYRTHVWRNSIQRRP